jgi:hypothetical protein
MFLADPTVETVVDAVKRIEPVDDEIVLILFGEDDHPDIPSLIEELNRNRIRFCGGIFPGIVHGTAYSSRGALILTLPSRHGPFLIPDLDTRADGIPDLYSIIANEPDRHQTAIIFLDGLAAGITSFLSEIFHQLGDSVHYLGAGAGSITLKQGPSVFSTEGCISGGAVVVIADLLSRLEVRHGWEYLTGPFVATKTHDNVLVELNWRSAFDVYRQALEDCAGMEITSETFFEIAKAHPFGMIRGESEYIVRDPISVDEDGAITCVGEIPENTVLSILKGNNRSLIDVAASAAKACSGDTGEGLRLCFGVDCISRVLFLEDAFASELDVIAIDIGSCREEIDLVGVLGLGEISSSGEGFLEFFNKTTVIGALK